MNQTAMKNKEMRLKEKELELRDKMGKRERMKDYLTAPFRMIKLGNTPKWYTKMVGTSSVGASVPTYFRQGLATSYAGSKIKGDPRIAVYNYVNTIGTQDTSISNMSTSDIQFALQYFYAETLQNNSRVPAEEAPEYGMYLLGWTDVASAITVMTKALAFASVFNDQNTAFGEKLINAIGFNYADLIANKANYIAQVNVLINEFNINSAVPVGMSYFERKLYLSAAVLTDTKSDVASLSIFRQVYYWNFDVASNSAKTVTFGAYGGTPILMSSWITSVRAMIKGLKDNQVCNMIKANILSAVPVSKLEQLTPLQDVANLAPKYFVDGSREREQLANAMTLPEFANLDGESLALGVTEDGYLFQGVVGALPKDHKACPRFSFALLKDGGGVTNIVNSISLYTSVLNFFHDDITSDDVIEASRFRYTAEAVGSNVLAVTSVGTELITRISVIDGLVNDDKTDNNHQVVNTILYPKLPNTGSPFGDSGVANYNGMFGWTRILSFDWAPLIWIYPTMYEMANGLGVIVGEGTPVTGSASIYEIVGDIGKLVTYAPSNVKVNNSLANKSLFLVDKAVFKQGF